MKMSRYFILFLMFFTQGCLQDDSKNSDSHQIKYYRYFSGDDGQSVKSVEEKFNLTIDENDFWKNNQLDFSTIDYVENAGAYIGTGYPEIKTSGMKNFQGDECYYYAYSSKYKSFILDHTPVYHLMEYLIGRNYNINHMGLICLDSKKFIESISVDISFNGKYIENELGPDFYTRKTQVENLHLFLTSRRSTGGSNVDSKTASKTQFERTQPNQPKKFLGVFTRKPEIDFTDRNILDGVAEIHPLFDHGFIANGDFKYGMKGVLGEGGFGKVYKVELDKKGYKKTNVAVKFFKKPITNTKQLPDRIKNSPFFVKDYGFSSDGKVQVLELGKGSLVDQYPKLNDKAFGNVQRGSIFNDVFLGMSVLHREKLRDSKTGFVHWDLKPHNIIIGFDKRMKIIDLDDVSEPTRDIRVGTTAYKSPERKNNNSGRSVNTQKSDIYSLGMMVAQARYGKYSLDSILSACCNIKSDVDRIDNLMSKISKSHNDGNLPRDEYVKLMSDAYKNHKKSHDDAINKLRVFVQSKPDRELELILDMLNTKPEHRPSIDDVLDRWVDIHPFSKRAQKDFQDIEKYFAGNVADSSSDSSNVSLDDQIVKNINFILDGQKPSPDLIQKDIKNEVSNQFKSLNESDFDSSIKPDELLSGEKSIDSDALIDMFEN